VQSLFRNAKQNEQEMVAKIIQDQQDERDRKHMQENTSPIENEDYTASDLDMLKSLVDKFSINIKKESDAKTDDDIHVEEEHELSTIHENMLP